MKFMDEGVWCACFRTRRACPIFHSVLLASSERLATLWVLFEDNKKTLAMAEGAWCACFDALQPDKESLLCGPVKNLNAMAWTGMEDKYFGTL